MRPVLCVPEKWWQGRGHWKQVRDQKTRWKTPKENEMRAGQRPEKKLEDPKGEGDETSAFLPEKWWHGRWHWKQVRD